MKKNIILSVMILAFSVAILEGCSNIENANVENEKNTKLSAIVVETTIESKQLVTFFDKEGKTIQKEECSKDAALFPTPVEMERDGYIFTGWDKDVNEILQQEKILIDDTITTVTDKPNPTIQQNPNYETTKTSDINQFVQVNPVYMDISDKTNVIATPAVYADKSQAFTVPLYVGGNVELCGIDLRVHYDTSVFQFVRFEENGNVVCNAKDGVLLLNYISTENVKKGFKLCDLVFQSKNEKVTDADVTVEIAEIVAIDGNGAFYTPQYETITSVITMY